MQDFNETVDGKLASRMRKVNPEQFLTLVRMHLSFELDINTEDNDPVTEKAKLKKWGLLSFSKKPKSMMNLQQKSEGTALTSEGISQVKKIIEHLSKEECINQEGIFRRTGKLTRQQELKTVLYQGQLLNLEDGPYSVHDCASVLKGFLAELPEPLLTELHYPAHCQIAELCSPNSSGNKSRLLRSLQLLLLLLPPANRILLKHLLNLLNKTASCESSNKMNCDTLATLFTPHLMCPRKLSPEALHLDSQNLSGLVAFMIRKGKDLFEIPPKLATDIRAYWVDQERRLLSPTKKDMDESMSDTTGTAHTVFSFVDHKLTAKANIADDTQAALAQLYAHIQAMPESAKKRRLVKQFNKENGQGTPRHVKQVRTKSLGDSIKKHIFQKKLLGHKKIVDINLGCNFSRSSSEENILSLNPKTKIPSKTLFSKSDEELSVDSFTSLENDNLLQTKRMSSSAGILDTPTSSNRKFDFASKNSINLSVEPIEENKVLSPANSRRLSKSLPKVDGNGENDQTMKLHSSVDREVRRYKSEPPWMYSSLGTLKEENKSSSRKSISVLPHSRRSNIEIVFTPVESETNEELYDSPEKVEEEDCEHEISPTVEKKFWNVYAAHTSTPSDFLRRNPANNDYAPIPIENSNKSMSPITLSTANMPKAMQVTMNTPRSRKPVMTLSGSNLCNLASINDSGSQSCIKNRFQIVNIDIDGQDSINSITEEPEKISDIENKENQRRPPFVGRNNLNEVEDECVTIQRSSMSITSTFREYLLSRSVLTASPVDLSFTSRTGDFEQSESDLNILSEERLSDSLLHCLDGNNPGSDTSGIASGSTNSANNSSEKIDDQLGPSPRKRGTSLQRNDSKRSIKNSEKVDDELREQTAMQKQCSESSLNSGKLKDNYQETSF